MNESDFYLFGFGQIFRSDSTKYEIRYQIGLSLMCEPLSATLYMYKQTDKLCLF